MKTKTILLLSEREVDGEILKMQLEATTTFNIITSKAQEVLDYQKVHTVILDFIDNELALNAVIALRKNFPLAEMPLILLYSTQDKNFDPILFLNAGVNDFVDRTTHVKILINRINNAIALSEFNFFKKNNPFSGRSKHEINNALTVALSLLRKFKECKEEDKEALTKALWKIADHVKILTKTDE